MNYINIFPHECSGDLAVIDGERAEHIKSVLKLAPGDTLRAGVVDKESGNWQISKMDEATVELRFSSPLPLISKRPLHLVLAMPRPKVFRRILFSCFTLGVNKITLINSARVEKSYWQSPFLSQEHIHAAQIRAMRQTGDMRYIPVEFEKRFKPYVEDRLVIEAGQNQSVFFHPYGTAMPSDSQVKTTFVVGPEGGFTPYEVEKLKSAGLLQGSLGARILTTEIAVTVAASQFA